MAHHASMFTRRQFMQLLAMHSVAATAHVAFPARATPSSQLPYDVIIIGAGMAGLTAAHSLIKQQKRVLVLEARGRIGGRAFTETRSLGGIPFDHGCSWLHSAQANPLTTLFRNRGVHTFAHHPEESISINGRPATTPELAVIDSYEATVLSAIETAGEQNKDVSVGALISPHTLPEHYAAARIGVLEAGVELSALSALEVHNQIEEGDDHLVKGGLGAAVAAYGHSLPITINSPVTRIEWGTHPIRIHTAHTHYLAKRLIITVPIGVLKAGHIQFSPALPPSHRKAIAAFRMGLLNKVGLRFHPGTLPQTAPFHEVGSITENAQLFDALLNLGHSDTAMCFVGGSHAHQLENLGHKACVEEMLSSLAALYGSHVRDSLTHHTVTAWGRDAYSKGAYSALKPGHYGAREALASPINGRIWFAGEALNETWSTQLAGAYLSGARAASEILKTLG